MAVFFIEIGNEVFVEGDTITDAVNKGVSMGYTDGYLRKSVVRDPLDRVNTKDKPVDNEKFAMRTFLNRIGLSGMEYKPLRKELMRNLSGDGAFRYGGPERCK